MVASVAGVEGAAPLITNRMRTGAWAEEHLRRASSAAGTNGVARLQRPFGVSTRGSPFVPPELVRQLDAGCRSWLRRFSSGADERRRQAGLCPLHLDYPSLELLP
jgi:hypothetical protein